MSTIKFHKLLLILIIFIQFLFTLQQRNLQSTNSTTNSTNTTSTNTNSTSSNSTTSNNTNSISNSTINSTSTTTPNITQLINSNSIINNYQVIKVDKNTTTQIQLTIQYKGSDTAYYQSQNAMIANLTFKYQALTSSSFSIQITPVLDKNSSISTLNIPYSDPYGNKDSQTPKSNLDGSSLLYIVKVTKQPFSFKVIRTSSSEVLFNTESYKFIFSQYYQEFTTTLPSNYLYGLGGSFKDFRLQENQIIQLYNNEYKNLNNITEVLQEVQGAHPVYLQKEQTNHFSLVFLRTSNLVNANYTNKNLNFAIFCNTTGILDLAFFLTDYTKKVNNVIKQYHEYIGNYQTMPFWSFGYQTGLKSFRQSSEIKSFLGQFQNLSLPLETIQLYLFSDYLNSQDKKNIISQYFSSNTNEIKNIKGQYQVKLIHNFYGSLNQNSSDYFTNAQSAKNLISTIGKIQGKSDNLYFIDFLSKNVENVWQSMIKDYYNAISFDGLCLDQNEYTNEQTTNIFTQSKNIWPDNLLVNKQAIPQTISINAMRADGVTEFDTHNLNGLNMAYYTQYAMEQVLNQNQPFILSKSNAFGSGQFSGYLIRDKNVTNDYNYQQYSLSQILQNQMFGIPFVGQELIFNDYVDLDMIGKIQFATLMPLARSTFEILNSGSQYFASNSNLFITLQQSLKLRYALLKQMYSIYFDQEGAGTIFRPLFFEYPEDLNIYNTYNKQILLGKNIMFFLNSSNNDSIIFPQNTTWYSFPDGLEVINNSTSNRELNLVKNSAANAYTFVSSGSIVFYQDVDGITKTNQLNQKFNVIMTLNKTNMAKINYTFQTDYTSSSNSLKGNNNSIFNTNVSNVTSNSTTSNTNSTSNTTSLNGTARRYLQHSAEARRNLISSTNQYDINTDSNYQQISYSEGFILGVSNYSDSQIINNCITTQDCIFNFYGKLYQSKLDSKLFTLALNIQNSNTKGIDPIFIKQISIQGLINTTLNIQMNQQLFQQNSAMLIDISIQYYDSSSFPLISTKLVYSLSNNNYKTVSTGNGGKNYKTAFIVVLIILLILISILGFWAYCKWKRRKGNKRKDDYGYAGNNSNQN